MKKNLFFFALVAVLATMAVSCQKENNLDPQSTVAEIGSVRTVNYSIDGTVGQVVLYGENEWSNFLDKMMTLSLQGHNVNFSINEYYTNIGAKETEVKTTTSSNEAKDWSDEKANQGYQVSVSYDNGNGQYTCVAHK